MKTEKNLYVIFVAGGSGTRMGTETPKQFLDLGGRPILLRTVELFAAVFPEMKPVIVLPAAHIDTWKKICREHLFDMPQIIVKGGITRFHSVKNALAKVPDGAFVLVQDGVRPLASEAFLASIKDALDSSAAAVIPVCPVTDTLKNLERGKDGVLAVAGPAPDRSRLFGAQTPQAFRSEELKAAYRRGFNTAFTDDASVAEAAGIPLTYVDGERYNIKITTPEDLEVARKLI